MLPTTFAELELELLPFFVIATTRNKINKDKPALTNSDRVFILSLRSCRKSIQSKGENVTSGTNFGECKLFSCVNVYGTVRGVRIEITFQDSVDTWRFKLRLQVRCGSVFRFSDRAVVQRNIYRHRRMPTKIFV